METIYFYSALVGGCFLVLQTVMLVIGIGGDTDTDVGHADGDLGHADASVDHVDAGDGTHAQDSFLKVLSLKAIVAFLTFFGLVGLTCHSAGWSPAWTLTAAVGAGLVAVYIVAWLMALLSKLQSGGNVQLRNAIGKTGRVYLRIPGNRSGDGRVTVSVQGRTVECKAVTAGDEIKTGAQVRVVTLSGDDTLEVEALGS